MEFPTLWLTLLPAAGGLGICSEELPVPGQGWSRSVFLCYLQADLERATSCWKAGIQALLHPAKRPKKEAGHSSSNSKRRKMGCVQDWRRGKQQKNTKRPLNELEEGTIQLFTSHTPWRMMCVQLRTRVSSFRRLCKHDWGAQLSSFAYCLYFYVIPLV